MPPDFISADNLRDEIREMVATYRYTDSNGEEREAEICRIDNIGTYTLSSNRDNDGDIPNFSRTASDSLSLQLPPQQPNNDLFVTHTTVPSSIGIGRTTNISTDIVAVWDRYQNGYIQPITRSANDRLAELMEDYIRNRNQEDKLFINHNTCQREIEYNSIDDVIEFREYLDDIIKEHYQGR